MAWPGPPRSRGSTPVLRARLVPLGWQHPRLQLDSQAGGLPCLCHGHSCDSVRAPARLSGGASCSHADHASQQPAIPLEKLPSAFPLPRSVLGKVCYC